MSLKHSILGMGNPLLDISADVDETFLAKYEVSSRENLEEREFCFVFFQLAIVFERGLNRERERGQNWYTLEPFSIRSIAMVDEISVA